MNKQRRAQVAKAMMCLETAIDITRDVKMDERFAMESIPENLQGTDRYEKMEDTVDDLDDAIEDMRSAKAALDKVIQG